MRTIQTSAPKAVPEGGRVLFLAQLPPPHHGQSAVAEMVAGILRDEAGLELHHMWRGGAKGASDVGKRTLSKYVEFASFMLALLWMVVTGKRFQLGYLGMAPWAHTLLRDAILAGFAKLLCTRVWLHVHGDGLARILNDDGWKMRLVRRLIAGTELIAITTDTARTGSASGVFSRVIDLPNICADPGHAAPEVLQPMTIGCLGNLDPRKGVLDFVDAVERIVATGTPVQAFIVGGPTAQLSVEDLRGRIAARGLERTITVTGRVSEEEKSRILRELDVFLYLSRHDLAPIALIEALAHGAAPIVLDIGGLREMVGAGFAKNILLPSLDHTELMSAIVKIIAAYRSDPVSLLAHRAAARARYVTEFSPARYRRRILAELGRPTPDTSVAPLPAAAEAAE